MVAVEEVGKDTEVVFVVVGGSKAGRDLVVAVEEVVDPEGEEEVEVCLLERAEGNKEEE